MCATQNRRYFTQQSPLSTAWYVLDRTIACDCPDEHNATPGDHCARVVQTVANRRTAGRMAREWEVRA